MKIFENLDINDLDGEIWKTIEGYPDYQISNFGRVKRVIPDKHNHKLKIMKQQKRGDYFCIGLSKNGEKKTKDIHRLVYEAFKGKLEEGYDAHHISENKEDNFINNLESKERGKHIKDHRMGKFHSEESKKKICKSHIGKYHSKETKKKIGIKNKGKICSEKTRELMGEKKKGEKNNNSKLKDGEVWLIKKILNSDYYKSGKITQGFIGKMFGVDQSIISAIKTERSWSHIKYERTYNL